MKTNLFPAVVMTVLCLVFFCGVYPTVVWGVAQLAPAQGRGVPVTRNGATVGFAHVGQSFTADRYFNSRPSAVGYNAAGSGGSNKGPTNPDYLVTVRARVDTFMAHNPSVKRSDVPAELVTASGSGLDPHLSPEAARVQVARVAKVRGVSEEKVQSLVDQHTAPPLLGLFGPPTVHVLHLNLALDQLQ